MWLGTRAVTARVPGFSDQSWTIGATTVDDLGRLNITTPDDVDCDRKWGVEVGPVLAALACSRMSAVSLTDPVRSGSRCQLFSQVGSAGDYGCGRCAPTGKIDRDGRSSRRFLPKGEVNRAAFRRAWGQAANGQDAWRAPRAGARSGHRTSCRARPGQASVGNDETKSHVPFPRAETRRVDRVPRA